MSCPMVSGMKGLVNEKEGEEKEFLILMLIFSLSFYPFLPHRVIDLHCGRCAFVSRAESTIQMKIKARDILGRDTLVLLMGTLNEGRGRVRCG